MNSLYRAVLEDRRRFLHITYISLRFFANYLWLQLQRIRTGGQATLTIVLIEHMGDIVASEPLSRLAAAQSPKAKVRWVVRKPYKEVVRNYPAVDQIITVHCLTEWLLLRSVLPDQVSWDLHLNGRCCYICNIPQYKSGPAAEISFETFYNIGNLLKVQCLNAGIPILTDGPVLTFDKSAADKVDGLGLPKEFVVIHAKSSEVRRDWQTEKWRELVAWLTQDCSLDVVEIGSESHIIPVGDSGGRSLCGELSTMESAEVIRRAVLYIGIDSGPAHIANAVGTQGVILLGHLPPFLSYTPYSGDYANGVGAELIRWDGPAEEITLEAVQAAVVTRLRCSIRVGLKPKPTSQLSSRRAEVVPQLPRSREPRSGRAMAD